MDARFADAQRYARTGVFQGGIAENISAPCSLPTDLAGPNGGSARRRSSAALPSWWGRFASFGSSFLSPKRLQTDRTRGHALVSLLALKLARALERRVVPLGLTVDDAVERLKGVRLVSLGDVQLGLWRLADRYPAAQSEMLGGVAQAAGPGVVPRKSQPPTPEQPRQGCSSG